VIGLIAAPQQQDTAAVFPLHDVIVVRDAVRKDSDIDFFLTNRSETTEEVLSRSVSAAMIRRGEYGWEPALRGLTGGRVSVTIDGMRIHGACTDNMDPVTIYVEPQNLYGIDIAAGSRGYFFGAPGGSVNMLLARPVFGVTFVRGGSGYQSSARSFSAYSGMNVSSGDVAVQVNGTYRSADSYRDGRGRIVPFSQYRKANISSSVLYRYSASSEFTADAIFDDGWNIGFPALPMDAGYAKARIASIAYRFNDPQGELPAVETKAYANSVAHYMDDTQRPAVLMHMDMPGWSATAGCYFSVIGDLHDKHRLTVRGEGYRTSARAEMTMHVPGAAPMFMLTLPDAVRSSVSLSIADEWRMSSSAVVTVDLRLESQSTGVRNDMGKKQFSVFGIDADHTFTFFLPGGGISLTQRVAKSSDLIFSLSSMNRAPTFQESYGYYLFNRFDGFDYIGSPNLRRERSDQVEISFRHSGARISASVSAFVNRMHHYIDGADDRTLRAMTPGAEGVKVYSNILFAVMYGAEGSISAILFPSVEVRSGASVLYGSDHNGQPIPLVPPFTARMAIRYRFSGMTLQGESEYFAAQERVRRSSGEATTTSSLLFHCRANTAADFAGAIMAIDAGIENLFDTAYRNHLDWGTMLRPGRNVYLSVSISR
jgi:iron complex outermembrane receptor protein